MGKKVREFKAGDFIFAKVKGYPAWPARVQGVNGKKYFIYFYGTGEIANLPPNMIFDYAENKDKFLTKTVKRKDFNDGARQIEHDFANNVPLEEVVGTIQSQALAESSMNITTEGNDTVTDDAEASADDTANVNESISTVNTTQNFDTTVEDSDEGGQLVIDEGKKARKPKDVVKTPAKTPKEPKTPRRNKKESEEETKVEEEIISRSGRKIKPKRYIDEHTPDNATLPSPVPKKRRVASPEKQKPAVIAGDTNAAPPATAAPPESCTKQYNVVNECEIAELQEPLNDDGDKENLLLAYLPSGRYVGVRLFQGRPASFKSPAARLQWERQAAKNAIRLKQELEKGLTNPKTVLTQLETDLNLTKEERSNLDKERELEEKKSRLQYLKTEMKMIDLDAKIKSSITIERVDFEQCFRILDEHLELDIKPLMLLKRPNCLETLKRLRCYAGDAQQLIEVNMDEAQFQEASNTLRSKANLAYNKLKGLFAVPEGLTFWEFFAGRVRLFNNVKEKMTKEQVLEMVHEPPELSDPSAYTMRAAIDSVNEDSLEDIKNTFAKSRKSIGKSPRRQSKQSNEAKKSAQSEKIVEQTETNTGTESEATKEIEQENNVTDKESTEAIGIVNDEKVVNEQIETPIDDGQHLNASSQNEDANRMDVTETSKDDDNSKTTDGNKKNLSDNDNIETSEEAVKSKEATDKGELDETKEKDDVPKSEDSDRSKDTEKSKDSDKSIDAEKSKDAESSKDSEKGKDTEKNKDSDKSKVAEKRKESEKDKDVDKVKETEKNKVSEKRRDSDRSKDAEKSINADKNKDTEKNKDKSDKSKGKNDKSKESNDRSKESIKSPVKSSKKDEKSNKRQVEVANEDGKSDENDNDKDKSTNESDTEKSSPTEEKSLEIKEETVEPRPKRGREASKKCDLLKSPAKKKSKAQ